MRFNTNVQFKKITGRYKDLKKDLKRKINSPRNSKIITMKTLNYTSVRSVYLLTSVLLVMFTVSSCARKMSFQTSSVVPAAEGRVKIKKDKNKNYNIDLNVMRLANPDRLNPPKEFYVVWMTSQGSDAKNIGQIKTSSSLLSKTLRSSLKTVSTTEPTGFFITAESDGNIQYPGGQVVLKTQ
jgi:hypothetical protein